MPAPLEVLRTPGPQTIIQQDDAERMVAWGVVGLPFDTGHVLALRVVPWSSLGHPYRSVWHRDPAGHWRMWADVEPPLACPRYFGRALIDARQAEIRVTWLDPWELLVQVDDGDRLEWHVRMAETRATRWATWLAQRIPERWWDRPRLTDLVGRVAGRMLGTGRLALQGEAPNGQRFEMRPSHVWLIPESAATVDGLALGPPGPVDPQSRLGDLRMPQRGLFAIGQASYEAFDPERHTDKTVGMVPSVLLDPSSPAQDRRLRRPAGRP